MRTQNQNYKRLPLLALCLVMLLAATGAQASELSLDEMLLEAPDTEGSLQIVSIRLLEDGSRLLGGQVLYPGEYRQPYRANYVDKEDTIRNDAFAMRMAPDGEVIWTLRLGDPQADNYFRTVGTLPDGRILMDFRADDSTFGDRCFIIGLDGVVEDMLSWRDLAEHYSPRSIMFMPQSGYLGGDSTVVDDYYDQRTGRYDEAYSTYDRVMTLLDFDMNVVWQQDFASLGDGIGNNDAMEGKDGIYLYGSEGSNAMAADKEQYLGYTSVLKLDKDTGEILWHLTDAPRDDHYGANRLLETQDGGLLFIGAYLPDGEVYEVGDQIRTLTRLSPEGEHLWTKRYDLPDNLWLRDIVPFEDGYVLVGSRWSAFDSYMLIYVRADGEPLGTLTFEETQERAVSMLVLDAAQDGKVYLSGTVHKPNDDLPRRRDELTGLFFGELKLEYFTMHE